MKRKLWSKDDIILAMWEWEETHGAPPKWNDWLLANGEDRPVSMTVRSKFGSWNEALKAAGLDVFKHPRVEIDEELAREMRRQGLTDTEIARELGVARDTIYKRLGPRPKPKPVGKKRTREQRIADLREALKEEP